MSAPKFGRHLRQDFLFDKDYVNLNHGSFGTYPSRIRTVLRSFQDASEARPDQFIRYDYPAHLATSRAAVAKLVNAPPETIVLVNNATTGINTVLRNLVYEEGDVVLYFATVYGACEKTVAYLTETTKVESVVVELAYPMGDDEILRLFEEKVKEVKEGEGGKRRVKVALFDTITALPGVRFPFERVTRRCTELGILSCVDAAHAVGHIELDLRGLDPDFFVSNCHKWLYVPRGCALLYVPLRNQHLIRSTLPTSHGFTPNPSPQLSASNEDAKVLEVINPLPPAPNHLSAFTTNFTFVGTADASPYLCIPEAIAYREKIGGEAKILAYCHTLAKQGGERVAEILGTKTLGGNDGGGCCFANVALPLDVRELLTLKNKRGGNGFSESSAAMTEAHLAILVRDWLTLKMVQEHDTFMALVFYANEWWVRLSAQVYLELGDFEYGAGVLQGLCERVKRGEAWAEE